MLLVLLIDSAMLCESLASVNTVSINEKVIARAVTTKSPRTGWFKA